MKSWIRTTALAALASAGCGAAYAQDAGTTASSSTGLGDVVITAQRRSENLQNAAIPVQAVSAADIEKRQVRDLNQLSQLTPALSANAQGGPYTAIGIRGVASNTTNAFGDPAVAVNVNGVALARSTSSRGLFYDIERVEVLPGPQGILYGRNATGGAVNVISKGPQLGKYGADLGVNFGSYDLRETTGAINVPFGDTLAGRLAWQTVDRNGYFDDGASDENRKSGRASLRWDPTSDISFVVRADYTKEKDNGPGGVLLAPNQGAEAVVLGDAFQGISNHPEYLRVYRPSGLCNDVVTAGPAAGAPIPNARTCSWLPKGFDDNEYWGGSGEMNWNIGGGVLTAIAAHRTDRYAFQRGDSFIIRETGNKADQDSLEVRYASNDEQFISYVAGAFYMKMKQHGDAVFDQQASGTSSNQHFDNEGSTWAGFGQLTFHINDKFRLNAGGRYTWEEKETNSGLFITRFYRPGIDPIGTTVANSAVNVALSKDWNNTDYRAGFEYDVLESSLLYGSVGTGFKSGGFFFTPDPGSGTYEPEHITAYTLGLKNRFFDRRLTLNLEGFVYKYEDQQVAALSVAQTRPTVIFPAFNAGNSTIKGISLDTQFLLTPKTLLSLNTQFLDTNYDDFVYLQALGFPNCPNTVAGATPLGPLFRVDCSGRPLGNSPAWTINGGIEHTFELSAGYTLVPSVNAHHESHRYAAINYQPISLLPSYTRVDASLTLQAPNDKWDIGIWANNLTDELVLFQPGRSIGGVNAFTSPALAPQTFGIRLNAHF